MTYFRIKLSSDVFKAQTSEVAAATSSGAALCCTAFADRSSRSETLSMVARLLNGGAQVASVCEITVAPDDVLARRDGRRVFRRIQTGHYREDDVKEIEAGAFALAVQHHSPGAEVQVLHLSDEMMSRISITGKPLQTKRKRLEAALSGIRAGEFAPDVSQYTCPNCPAFFVCGPVPAGSFQKKFG
jgi:hypothetical protein